MFSYVNKFLLNKYFFLIILSIKLNVLNAAFIIPDGQNVGLKNTQRIRNGLALNEEISSRVLGGKEAKPHSAPYIISIQEVSSTEKRTHICGGVIINENWILTAAHCLQSQSQIKNLIVVAGAHNIDTKENTIQTRKIDYYKNHDLYNGGINPYDIALIYVKEKLQFNSYVNQIKLPKLNDLPNGNALLYGWGSTSKTNTPIYPGKLHFVDLPIINNDLCINALGSQGYKIHKTNLCTGPLDGGKGICQADSGGPLIQSNYLIGIVSWGKTPCGQPNSPSVFVRASAFIDWINKIQKQKL